METDRKRFEIARVSEENQPSKYRVSEVHRPFSKDSEYMKAVRRPLIDDDLDILYGEVDWTDLQWGEDSLIIGKNKEFTISPLNNYKYYTV